MNLQEDIHAIRQSLERLVHHLASDKRSGAIDHRDGQRDSTLQRETESKRTQKERETKETPQQWYIRNSEEKQSWGPFQNINEAWKFIHKEINWEGEHIAKDLFVSGSKEEKFAEFEKIGTYYIEKLWIVKAHT